MNSTILISIIIPVYNVENYLEECLQSVATASKSYEKHIEVIIVDDGSKDQSGEIADFYATIYSFMRVIHQNNAGVANARNTGIKEACGEWIYFMDSDDYLAQNAIQIFIESISIDTIAEVFLFDAYKDVARDKNQSRLLAWEHFDLAIEWNNRISIKQLQRSMLYYPTDFPKMKVPLAAPWDKLYRRSILENTQIKFRGQLKVLDDMVFNMEIFGRAKHVVYVKEKIYFYRYVEDSITNSYKKDRVLRDREVWKFIRQYIDEIQKDNEFSMGDIRQFEQCYYSRIIKSFAIALKLSLFHKKNNKTFAQKIQDVATVLKYDEYEEAFENCKIRDVEWKLKSIVFLGRQKCIVGIYLLYLLERCSQLLKNRKKIK